MVDIKDTLKHLVAGDREGIKAALRGEVVSDLTPQEALNLSLNAGQVKTAEPTVADSVAATLAQRGSRYGDFTDHARVCQHLKHVMVNARITNSDGTSSRKWTELDDVKKQALEVIADKIARILTGDPNYDDNWHDIQGYAKLVEDRLPKAGSTK